MEVKGQVKRARQHGRNAIVKVLRHVRLQADCDAIQQVLAQRALLGVVPEAGWY